MIQIRKIQFSAGHQDILREVNWNITPGTHAALVGPNGAGKTTLLRIICGEHEDYKGDIIIPSGQTIGYLPQEERAVESGEILNLVIGGHKEAAELELRLFDINHRLKSHPADEKKLLNQLGHLEDRYRNLGGYDLEFKARSILSGLGFKEEEFHRNIGEFSGGWRMRVYLSRILVSNPDILLLDEPTNHLDLQSLEWLEQYLQVFAGTVVMVSHDRFFIDRLAREIVELNRGKIICYKGNFQAYEKQKEENDRLLHKQFEEQQAEREKMQRWIDRFRYKATKAAQVQSRIKQLEKMELIEIPPPLPQINFRLECGVSSYKDVFKGQGIDFKYDQDWIFKDINLDIYRGDRLSLVGVNGAGKTTLTKLITGNLIPQKGEISIGKRVQFGYYAQHQIDNLDLDLTVLQHVMKQSGYSEARIRNILGVFMFSGEDVFKKIKVLSGGEKARLTLAGILANPSNFLIMDEPTNHLDMTSKKALEEALLKYEGTLLLISHDRYFLDRLISRVVEVKDGGLKVFEGNYSAYLGKRQQITAKSMDNDLDNDNLQVRKSKDQKRLAAEIRQASSKKRNRLKRNIEEQEGKIHEFEVLKEDIEAKMASKEIYENPVKSADLSRQYQDVNKTLTVLYSDWEKCQIEYEKLLQTIDKMILEAVN